ncbi:MAG: protein phosphatase 2C domain-containing protein [Acidobacteriota bacterium]|nr:protein phosphatase 2C domain-containing protein [Blastocatellia bacterium]MDW8412134.1 protein phosphatase 2C domain-containing protein [Acidobacteriota bacterium]
MPSQITLSVFGITDKGMVRSQNQDAYLIAEITPKGPAVDYSTARLMANVRSVIEHRLSPTGYLLAVADGMGGAAAGDVASQMGLDTLLAGLNEGFSMPDLEPIEVLKRSVELANLTLWQESQMKIDYRGMGTTLTAVYIRDATAYLAQVGDSRAYLIRDGRIGRLTHDQSAVQMLVDLGRLTEEQARWFPNRNLLLQALGIEPRIQVALTKVSLCRDDCLLLCSDGLVNKLDDDEILDVVLQEPGLDIACQTLVRESNYRGGEDNITVLMAKFAGEGLAKSNPEVTIWSSVEIVSKFQPQGYQRGVHTSKMMSVDLSEYKKRTE